MKELKKGSMNEKMDLTYDIVFDEYVIVPIIEKLVGNIHAIGSCEVDKERYENLKNLYGILFKIIDKVCDEAYRHSDYRRSVSASGDKAIEILKDLKVLIDDTLQEVGEIKNEED